MVEQHTPGPWHLEEMETRKRQYRIRCDLGKATGGRGMIVVERIELDHDARLIAAAPDLLAVAAELEDHLRRGAPDGPEGPAIRARLKAALAKATGQ